MSIPVEPGAVARRLAEHATGYLLSTAADGRVKAVALVPPPSEEAPGVLRVPAPGRGSLRNAGERPAVTLLLPPAVERGHTLLVDGTAAVDGDDLVVTVTSAVLHRPAAHADGPVATGDGACGHDCVPLD